MRLLFFALSFLHCATVSAAMSGGGLDSAVTQKKAVVDWMRKGKVEQVASLSGPTLAARRAKIQARKAKFQRQMWRRLLPARYGQSYAAKKTKVAGEAFELAKSQVVPLLLGPGIELVDPTGETQCYSVCDDPTDGETWQEVKFPNGNHMCQGCAQKLLTLSEDRVVCFEDRGCSALLSPKDAKLIYPGWVPSQGVDAYEYDFALATLQNLGLEYHVCRTPDCEYLSLDPQDSCPIHAKPRRSLAARWGERRSMIRIWRLKAMGFAKNCPSCSSVIIKNGGCNHIHCSCAKSFCWRCRKVLVRGSCPVCKK